MRSRVLYLWIVLGLISFAPQVANAQLDSTIHKADSVVKKAVTVAATAVTAVDSALLLWNWNVDTALSTKHIAGTWDERMLVAMNHVGYGLGIDKAITFFTNATFITCVVFPVGIYGIGLARQDHDQALAGLTLGLELGASTLVTEGIKAIVKRQRPFHVLLGVRTPSAGAGGYSFPSGHSTAAWSLASGLSFQYPHWYVIAPAFLYATAVSLSRPYLGVHYLSDLLAGAIVGITTSYAVYKLEAPIGRLLSPILPNASPASVSAARAQQNHHSFGFSISSGVLQPIIY
jgi:membrane-associated phospholipid phosphatase